LQFQVKSEQLDESFFNPEKDCRKVQIIKVKSEQLDESFFNLEKDCRKVQVIKANFRVNNWIS
jgi:hypothetical protein